MNTNSEVFFSYAWDDQVSGESREKLVNELYQSLVNDNYTVIRDKNALGYIGSISEFIDRLGKGGCIVVAITEKYLQSPYCMFELYEIARHSHLDQQHFRNRIIPIMIEFVDFNKPATIEFYLSFWENEFKVWDDLVRRRSGQLAIEQLRRYDKVKMIHQNFGKLSDWLSDINTLNPRILSENNFAEIRKAISRCVDTHTAPGWRTTLTNPRVLWTATVAMLLCMAGWFLVVHKPAAFPKKAGPANTQNAPVREPPSGVTASDSPAKKIVRKKEVSAPNVPMCDLVIDTKGTPGVDVAFVDPVSTRRYHAVSGNGKVTFSVPCYLLTRKVPVTFRKNNVVLESEGYALKNPPVITAPPVSNAAAMCSVTCNTRGYRDVAVSIEDPERNTRYTQVSKDGALIFSVPCSLLTGKYKVSFKRDQTEDSRTFYKLKEFSITDAFEPVR